MYNINQIGILYMYIFYQDVAMEKLCRLFYQSSWFFLSIAPSKLPVELVVRFFAAGKISW